MAGEQNRSAAPPAASCLDAQTGFRGNRWREEMGDPEKLMCGVVKVFKRAVKMLLIHNTDGVGGWGRGAVWCCAHSRSHDTHVYTHTHTQTHRQGTRSLDSFMLLRPGD